MSLTTLILSTCIVVGAIILVYITIYAIQYYVYNLFLISMTVWKKNADIEMANIIILYGCTT